MNKSRVKKEAYNLGLYRIYWKQKCGGGSSLASVGQSYDGTRWYSPCNWTGEVNKNSTVTVASTDWSDVKSVELLFTDHKD